MKHGIDDNWLVCDECGEWHNPEHGIICDKCGSYVDLEWANARMNDADERIVNLTKSLKAAVKEFEWLRENASIKTNHGDYIEAEFDIVSAHELLGEAVLFEKPKCLHAGGKNAVGKQLQCIECGELFDPRNYGEVGQVELYGHGRSLRGWQKRELYEPEL